MLGQADEVRLPPSPCPPALGTGHWALGTSPYSLVTTRSSYNLTPNPTNYQVIEEPNT